MNATKPPIYRSNAKGSSNYESKVIGESKTVQGLRRNLSIPNINIEHAKQELSGPGVLERSTSLSSLSNVREARLSTKSLSASNILALSDPNLSLQEAKPKKFYDSPSNSSAKQKTEYTAFAQMYFYQLTEGCSAETCKNKFCKSCSSNILKKLNNDENFAVMFSLELATSKSKHLCVGCKNRGKLFPQHLLEHTKGKPVQFLCLLSTMTPFRSLYKPCPLVSSEFSDENKHRRSASQGNLADDLPDSKTDAGKFYSSISNIAGQVSSSIFALLASSKTSNKTSSRVDEDAVDGNFRKEKFKRKVSDSGRIFGDDTYIEGSLGDLRDFEQSVASEMIGSPNSPKIKEFSLTHLTLEMLDHILEDYNECGDPSFILNTLRTVFSSMESLNSSFLTQNGFAYSTESREREINKDDVCIAYKKLQNCDNGAFMSTILDSLKILCSEMLANRQTIESINQFVIIFELPMFYDSNLPYIMVEILQGLPKAGRVNLIKQFSKYDRCGFVRILKGFQSLLSSLVSDKVVSDPNILTFCNVIGLLSDANCWPNKTPHIVEDAEFYNDDLSKSLDVKKEYEHWQNIIHPVKRKQGLSRSASWSNLEVTGSILQYPFLLRPETKVHLIHYEAINEMRQEYQTAIVHQAKVQTVERVLYGSTEHSAYYKSNVWSEMCPYLVLEVRREFLVEDALEQLREKMSDLKKPLKIKYIGGGEQGLDMGGLQKEFFQLGVEKLFDPAYGMFIKCGETRNVWFNSHSFESDSIFELTGMILGLAIYNGIILDLPLPGVLYAKLRGRKPTLKDVWDIEPTVARSLTELLDYNGDIEEDMCLDFQVVDQYLDSTEKINLLPGGKDIAVTRKNRQLYAELYVNYLLTAKVERQFTAFAAGFSKVCNGDAINLFRANELELLICGIPEIDFSQLEKVTTYIDGYTEEHILMKHFWQVINDFSYEQKKSLLSFVTGSDRVPLSGLGSISFIIQRNGPDTNNLPTSMTCFNRLLLPEYNSRSKLQEKLSKAIENGKGFGLT